MATEWPELPLEECMAAVIDYRGKTPRKTTSGIPLVTAKIIKGGRIERPEEFIDPADYDDWMRRGIPKAGDIVLTTEAPLGEVAQLDGSKVALAQRVITLRGKEGLVDNTFLKFLLQSKGVQEQLKGRSTGTTVHGIRQSELRKVLLPVPPFNEQRAIAHILGTLDDKIELNRRMNETLETMAQAIFKSWFVDFAPIPGLGPHKEWQDSPLGRIPKGWRVKKISEVLEINPSRPIKRGIEYTHVDMASLPTASGRVKDITQREFKGSGSKFRNGDVLVARITPCLENGKTALVDFLSDDECGWGSTEFIVFGPKKPLSMWFMYCLARDQEFREHAIRSMSGTSGRQRVDIGCFNNYMIVIPPATVIDKFGDIVGPWFNQMKANDDQSRTLAAIREVMIPKLLAGEIRVMETVEAIEGAA